jgi:UDP-N-acetylenolpyruvoylglucosamine reductase
MDCTFDLGNPILWAGRAWLYSPAEYMPDDDNCVRKIDFVVTIAVTASRGKSRWSYREDIFDYRHSITQSDRVIAVSVAADEQMNPTLTGVGGNITNRVQSSNPE